MLNLIMKLNLEIIDSTKDGLAIKLFLQIIGFHSKANYFQITGIINMNWVGSLL